MLPIATLPLLALLPLLLTTALSPGSTPAAIQATAQRGAPSSQTPDRKNVGAWADFIRPSAEELKFESIGWRNQFWPAVLEAKKLGRPILLWTMNGHPLGCT
ncbi:hypothetical protein Poly30_49700 [Planctomycetes bacterium Poly30]|uniref:Uncharacterized protein n=1 Tax=Saltatorellus ferox TaxID=2528018 RepID=A0A518EZ89_9BACT|nr:hypothetical protein Poly30_49700 [Planctomycetes bacterium Poly30]